MCIRDRVEGWRLVLPCVVLPAAPCPAVTNVVSGCGGVRVRVSPAVAEVGRVTGVLRHREGVLLCSVTSVFGVLCLSVCLSVSLSLCCVCVCGGGLVFVVDFCLLLYYIFIFAFHN